MTDYDCSPLWDMDEGLQIDIDDLPLTHSTKERLLKWSDIYDEILNMDDPASSGFASKEDEEAFEEEGIKLWQKLKEEIGKNCQVFYFSYKYVKLFSELSEITELQAH